MAKTKSSRRWLDRQHSDPYTQLAKKQGYRSRAVFKLLDIQKKDHLIKKGMTIIDLGAAPGGFSQIAADLVGQQGKVIALDILPMDPIKDVDIIIGDFQEEAVLNQLITKLDGRSCDLIMSDMAPNISGISAIDQPRSIYLAELALDLAQSVLKKGGGLLVKLFQGEGFDEYSTILKRHFNNVSIRKPGASRPESRELYLVAKDFCRN